MFVTWTSDHAPRHVHVYRDGQPMKGEANDRLRKLMDRLVAEGAL